MEIAILANFAIALFGLIYLDQKIKLHAETNRRREVDLEEDTGPSAINHLTNALATIESQLHAARVDDQQRLRVPVQCHGGLFDDLQGSTGIAQVGDLFTEEGPEGKQYYLLAFWSEGSWKAHALPTPQPNKQTA